MAFTENLDQFFDTDDFAAEAVINTTPPRTVKVIFDTPSQSVEIYDTSVETDSPFLRCKTSDLSGVREGHTATIGAAVFKIKKVTHDGTGISTMYLK